MREIAALFGCESLEFSAPRFNIAPTQPIAAIIYEHSKKTMKLMRWGFVPAWVKEPENFSLIINARSESVTEKPSFKNAIRYRRCIIPADGFYEWHRDGKRKTPYFIRPKTGDPIGYAGIFETYMHANGSEIDTICFVTTAASHDISAIHHRMPVRVPIDKIDRWLDCANYSPDDVTFFYNNSDADFYDIIPISERVNKVSNDDSDVQKPVQSSVLEEQPGRPDQLSLF